MAVGDHVRGTSVSVIPPRGWASWPRKVVPALGTINILLGLAGIYALWAEFYIFTHNPHDFVHRAPYLDEAFHATAAVDLVCLVTIIVGGILLLRIRRSGRVICNLLFSFEIAYWLFIAALGLIPGGSGSFTPVIRSVAAAAVLGNLGMGPQMISAYPIIALVVLNLAYHRLNQKEELSSA